VDPFSSLGSRIHQGGNTHGTTKSGSTDILLSYQEFIFPDLLKTTGIAIPGVLDHKFSNVSSSNF